jgi:hypothetical protein
VSPFDPKRLGTFSPEHLKLLKQAYDGALRELRISPGKAALNDIVAKRVLSLCRDREMTPAELQHRVVEELIREALPLLALMAAPRKPQSGPDPPRAEHYED